MAFLDGPYGPCEHGVVDDICPACTKARCIRIVAETMEDLPLKDCEALLVLARGFAWSATSRLHAQAASTVLKAVLDREMLRPR